MEKGGDLKICIRKDDNNYDKKFLDDLNNKRIEIISNVIVRLIREDKL